MRVPYHVSNKHVLELVEFVSNVLHAIMLIDLKIATRQQYVIQTRNATNLKLDPQMERMLIILAVFIRRDVIHYKNPHHTLWEEVIALTLQLKDIAVLEIFATRLSQFSSLYHLVALVKNEEMQS